MPRDFSISFNRPYLTGKELSNIREAHAGACLAGDGPFTRLCHRWLEERTGSVKALLTHSCTAALEMAALLLNIGPGDEVIVPSFTFVSTANAFVLRGATPVFVDIRPDTLNLDEALIEAAITERTRAIVPVHYAGVGCAMDEILAVAGRYGVAVVEDAAQALGSFYKGRALGGIGAIGCFSFHETKNLISGEGGALCVLDKAMGERAEILREKGTNRSRFFAGQVDKYTWCDIGSSYLPGELTAAFLWAQLEAAQAITAARLALWDRYHNLLEPLQRAGLVQRPTLPPECLHNGHLYFVLLPNGVDRGRVLSRMNERGVNAVFHYVPLHSSPMGQKVGRVHGRLTVTESAWARLIRLPLWIGLTPEQQEQVVAALAEAVEISRVPADC